MSMRVILVPLFGNGAEGAAIAAASSIAHRFDGHMIGLFVRVDPSDVVPFFGEGISPAAIEQLTRATHEEMDRRRDAAREALERGCSASGMTVTDQPEVGSSSATFLEVTGRRDDLIQERARLADLLVFAAAAVVPGAEERGTVEAALLGSGRPVLIVPDSWQGSIGHQVAIAWNGRSEAARALTLAMPFIEAAGICHVLTAETSDTSFAASEDVSAYLRWHGVTCERHRLEPQDEPVGAALLRSAAAHEADLLVMGGYGRSRLSELVLGGVTRHVFANPSVPILLAH